MEHWFDDLSRALSISRFSRRDAIRGVAAVFAANRFPPPRSHRSQSVSQGPSPRIRPKPLVGIPRSVQRGPCTIIQNGPERTRHFLTTTSSGGKTVAFSETRFRAPGITTTHFDIL
jgi:hypothetical protein